MILKDTCSLYLSLVFIAYIKDISAIFYMFPYVIN